MNFFNITKLGMGQISDTDVYFFRMTTIQDGLHCYEKQLLIIRETSEVLRETFVDSNSG